jgi:hypothetical protein
MLVRRSIGYRLENIRKNTGLGRAGKRGLGVKSRNFWYPVRGNVQVL